MPFLSSAGQAGQASFWLLGLPPVSCVFEAGGLIFFPSVITPLWIGYVHH